MVENDGIGRVLLVDKAATESRERNEQLRSDSKKLGIRRLLPPMFSVLAARNFWRCHVLVLHSQQSPSASDPVSKRPRHMPESLLVLANMAFEKASMSFLARESRCLPYSQPTSYMQHISSDSTLERPQPTLYHPNYVHPIHRLPHNLLLPSK